MTHYLPANSVGNFLASHSYYMHTTESATTFIRIKMLHYPALAVHLINPIMPLCLSLHRLLAFLCTIISGIVFMGLQPYIGRDKMNQQIAPPNSTLPYPVGLSLRSIALGIGSQTYHCQEAGNAKFQGSHGILFSTPLRIRIDHR
jgi:hypothetical protein